MVRHPEDACLMMVTKCLKVKTLPRWFSLSDLQWLGTQFQTFFPPVEMVAVEQFLNVSLKKMVILSLHDQLFLLVDLIVVFSIFGYGTDNGAITSWL